MVKGYQKSNFYGFHGNAIILGSKFIHLGRKFEGIGYKPIPS